MTGTPEFEDAVAKAIVAVHKLGAPRPPVAAVFECGVQPADRIFRSMARISLPRLEGYYRLSVGPVGELRDALIAHGGRPGRVASVLLAPEGPSLYLVGLMAAGIQVGVRGARGTMMAGVVSWDDGTLTRSRPGDSFLGRSLWGSVSLPDGSGFVIDADDPRTGSLARMLAQAAASWPAPILPQPVWDDCPFDRRLSADDFAGAVLTHYARHPEAVAIALHGLRDHCPDGYEFLTDVLGRWRLLPVRCAAEAILEAV